MEDTRIWNMHCCILIIVFQALSSLMLILHRLHVKCKLHNLQGLLMQNEPPFKRYFCLRGDCALCLPCMMHQWPHEVHPRHPDHTSSCQPPPWPALLRRWESGLDWWQPSPVQRSSRPSEHFSATQLLGLHSNAFLRHSKLSSNLFC